MKPEYAPNANFKELKISEMDIAYLDNLQKFNYVIELMKENNCYQENAFYCGINSEEVRQNKSFGNRVETWAVDEKGFMQGVKDHDRLNSWREDPLGYAMTEGDPALVVYAADSLDPIDDGSSQLGESLQWRLSTKYRSMDDAVLAVIYIES